MTGDQIQLVGPLIHKRKTIGPLDTPACEDGIILTPNGMSAIMMVAPTPYDPSGQRTIPLTPREVLHALPYRLNVSSYHYSRTNMNLSDWIKHNGVGRSLPQVKNADFGLYELPGGDFENTILQLSRMAFRDSLVLEDVLAMEAQYVREKSTLSERKYYIKSLLGASTIDQYLEREKRDFWKAKYTSLSRDASDRLEYYLNLSDLYGQLVRFVAKEFQTTENLARTASVTRQLFALPRESISELPSLFKRLASGEDPTT